MRFQIVAHRLTSRFDERRHPHLGHAELGRANSTNPNAAYRDGCCELSESLVHGVHQAGNGSAVRSRAAVYPKGQCRPPDLHPTGIPDCLLPWGQPAHDVGYFCRTRDQAERKVDRTPPRQTYVRSSTATIGSPGCVPDNLAPNKRNTIDMRTESATETGRCVN